jgi:hypothetical protein
MSGVLHGVIASLAGRVTDTFWKYVTLLLNTTSTNGAQNNTFLDSSTNNFTVTRNGDTTQGSFNPYMPSGYWSGFFDGNGDYLSAPDNAAWAFGTGDFTIEAWINLSALSAYQRIVSQQVTTTGIIFRVENTNKLAFYINNTLIATATTTFTVGQWYHVAVARSGSTLQLFVNGTSEASVSNSTNIADIADVLTIGAYSGLSEYLTGYISNVRVVKGTAVYTAAFTPPTTPLTAITNTSLLCLQDNRFKDNSTNAFAITVNGDTRISKFAPFNIPASYSTASYGGSGYFDGTGDDLQISTNAAFALGTGDFTFDAWINPSNWTNSVVPFFVVSGTGGFWVGKNGSNFVVRAFGVADQLTYGTLPTVGAWTHIVAVRSGTTLSMYYNGTRVATATNSYNFAQAKLAVGSDGDSVPSYYTGYISNARLVKGTAVYDPTLTTLTIPTAPLTAITNTSLLLNFTNAGIYDAATINDGQTVGNAQVSTTQAKWGTTSMVFDGTGDYIPKVDRPELRLGTGDFTIEGWVYLTATGVAYGLLSKGTSTTGWSVNVTSGNKLQFSYTATQLTGATSLASGTWYYFAVVRSGTASGNLKVYLNGSADATSAGAVNDDFNQTSTMYVGADRVAGAVLNGYLQDVRVTNGYARTIATPTAAFPTL